MSDYDKEVHSDYKSAVCVRFSGFGFAENGYFDEEVSDDKRASNLNK